MSLSNERPRCEVCIKIIWSPKSDQKLCGKPCRFLRKKFGDYASQMWKKIKEQGYYQSLRFRVIEGYGGICACCKEMEKAFLTIDHVNNDGYKERAQGLEGRTFLRYIIRNKFPSSYQILCWNCQLGKKICGVCPHRETDTSQKYRPVRNKSLKPRMCGNPWCQRPRPFTPKVLWQDCCSVACKNQKNYIKNVRRPSLAMSSR